MEEVKLSLFPRDMTLHVENPKGSIRKLLELMDKFTEASGYKINSQKSIAFLYNINKHLLNEVKIAFRSII